MIIGSITGECRGIHAMANTIPEFDIEELLKGSPARCFELSDEDRAWLNMQPVGKEYGSELSEDANQ
jgi:hypothetical protein